MVEYRSAVYIEVNEQRNTDNQRFAARIVEFDDRLLGLDTHLPVCTGHCAAVQLIEEIFKCNIKFKCSIILRRLD